MTSHMDMTATADNDAPRPRRRRVFWYLAAAAVLLVLIRGPAQRALNEYVLLKAEAPQAEAIDHAIEQSRRPEKLLQRLWETGRIPHRYQAIQFLHHRVPTHPELVRGCAPLLHQATQDCDVAVRELAFGTLASIDDPNVLALARTQLDHPDPEVRILGLRYLTQQGSAAYVPTVISFLDDPEPAVVTTADVALRRWTGQDFGLRLSMTVRRWDSADPGALDPENLARINNGVARWKIWWEEHAPRYGAPPDLSLPALAHEPAREVLDFELPMPEGAPVRLSAFRGKTVLLNFWATWCTNCRLEIPTLRSLQAAYPEQLVILGLCQDGRPDAHGHNHDDDHALAEHAERAEQVEEAESTSRETAILRAKIARIIEETGVNYPVLLDGGGRVADRFRGHELPTHALISPSGQILSRFLGGRSRTGYEELLRAASRADAWAWSASGDVR